MSRLITTTLAVAALLAVMGVALATAGGNAREQQQRRGPVASAGGGGGQVVDLSAAADAKAAEHREHSRPQEDVAHQDLASIERDIKTRSKRVLGASPDDGIAPGAPSDKEVRAELREMESERDGGGPIKRGSGDFIYPINGQFTSPFGQRWGRLHAGIDLAAPTGRPIRAAASGRVILASPTGGYGNYTCVAHNSSISTCYAHQSRFGARMGESVSQGDVIGYVGNTGHSFGAHLHFEVRVGGRPVDPMKYL